MLGILKDQRNKVSWQSTAIAAYSAHLLFTLIDEIAIALIFDIF
jgi:hypothetical protein